MTNSHLQYVTAPDGVRIAADVRGSGPLVLFVHGFPELRQSWNRLAAAVADAGYAACAIDVRGYGDSDRPAAVADYRMEAIVADLVAVADALALDAPVTLVGHDWGASIVWNAIMARPDRFGAVAALSIPWLGRAAAPFDAIFTRRFTDKGRFFYQAYFQEPGVAEAELEADPALFLRAFYHCISGDAAPGDWPNDKPHGAKLLDGLRFPDAIPSWLEPGYFDHAAATFARTGFAGALNRYRNHGRDFEWAGGFDPVIRRPALFVGGSSDPALVLGTADPIPLMREVVPDLEAHMLAGCGHWTQAERAAEVEALLIPWLRRTIPA
ncbi:MAG TPA: alpha/beta fold hydrolase [Sphingopyxis sp.]|nr:alpha/beta fold hydrolase [Sphingopyxis sp.]HMP46461.1 alpha/beta fold hydrolase [Sphingopyxis sp.]HMQ18035.1 alpha/beta fold hydrolase [Sphingopyxis sp.]